MLEVYFSDRPCEISARNMNVKIEVFSLSNSSDREFVSFTILFPPCKAYSRSSIAVVVNERKKKSVPDSWIMSGR